MVVTVAVDVAAAVRAAVDVDMAVRVAVAVGVVCDVLVIAAVGLGAIPFVVDVTVGVAVGGTGVDATG